MFKKIIPGSTSSLSIVDHGETYGRHVLRKAVSELGMDIKSCVDIGCGKGDDLKVLQASHPNAKLHGVDFGDWNMDALLASNITPFSVNIESEPLPFDEGSIDFVIANQVMEHTKEVFWINHEIFRILRVGGYLYLGVPNVLSLHNKLVGLFGKHPTQWKLLSAHVRPFSVQDTLLFYKTIAPDFCSVKKVLGSQFYPFPKPIARILSHLFPASAFSIFFLIQKTAPGTDAFLKWPAYARLETNFFVGNRA